MKYFIGLDIGTKSLRACLFDQFGVRLAVHTIRYITTYPATGQAEQDANDWWNAAVEAIKTIVSSSQVNRDEIVAISYACTSCTLVMLDRKGQPLRPAILWMDERATQEADRITDTGDPVLKYSGNIVSPQWMLPKTAWLMKHEPELFDKAYRIVEQTDFITYKLSGKWTLSYSNLVAKWNYANPVGGWSAGFLDRAGVAAAKEKWPKRILTVGAKVGNICSKLAKITGLCDHTLVIQGGIDSHAAMVGVSVVDSGDSAIIMGTSTVIHAQSNKPIFADIWGPYPDAIIKGMYTLGGGQTTTGSIIDWLLSNFSISSNVDLQALLPSHDEEAAKIPIGSDGLVVLNYFQGNRTPVKDTKARGAIWGLTLWHKLPHILRAVYEANSFGTRHIFENMELHGFIPKRIVVGGGGSKSDLALHILAGALGRQIERAQETECTALGSAIWAAIGSGVYASYRDAVDKMVTMKTSIDPDPENYAKYNFYYDQYLKTYVQLRPLFAEVVDYEEKRKRSVEKFGNSRKFND